LQEIEAEPKTGHQQNNIMALILNTKIILTRITMKGKIEIKHSTLVNTHSETLSDHIFRNKMGRQC